ncbi:MULTISPECIES: YqiJ family protein [unclassified Acinetobacter]|uniref:YqiJ family protein n=1 Tax=unclassified Acinetobacter TaxID=196816 RepID=UPI00190AE677|nr:MULTISPECIES: YqiJ family protein [unclassified Acinetobacter]MBK0064049.1 YqiJ family protein [Acinetobacter sp. S55]MBK0067442.1 YqiJ family protein [Acinetobacter sp. S54]
MLWELFTHPSNYIFSISLVLCLAIGILELLLLLIGGSSQVMDQFLPEQLSDYQTDFDLEADHGMIWQFFDWLYLGRIPLLIWLIIFLTTYALTGFIIQGVFYSFTEHYFSVWLIAPAVLFLSMPFVRWASALVSKIIPKDETTAIFSEDLIGQQAEIILGIARPHSPAQAKVKDQFGQTHYVLVEPEQDEIFQQGQTVILTQKNKLGFQAISQHIND